MIGLGVGRLARLVEIRNGNEPTWIPGAVVQVEAGPNPFYPVTHDWVVRTTAGVVGHVLSRQLEPILPSGHQPSEYTFQELMDECRQVTA